MRQLWTIARCAEAVLISKQLARKLKIAFHRIPEDTILIPVRIGKVPDFAVDSAQKVVCGQALPDFLIVLLKQKSACEPKSSLLRLIAAVIES